MAQSMRFSPLRCVTGLAMAWLVVAAMLALPAQARDDKPTASGRSSGSRGCGMSTASTAKIPSLILLSPSQHTGQTTSTQPTLAWFVRDAVKQPLTLRLYEVVGAEHRLLKEVTSGTAPKSAGIMVYSLADAGLDLAVGKQYRWQVELVCDPNNPSGNLSADAAIAVVATQSESPQHGEQGDRQPLLLSGKNNRWYDVLSQAMGTTNKEMSPALLAILENVAVNATERQVLQSSQIQSFQP